MTEIARDWAYAEEFITEDEILLDARERAAHLGTTSVTPAVGSALRLLAATAAVRTAVEIGTGTGVGSLWLLSGMTPDGVLTTIDSELELHKAARLAFSAAGIRPVRCRAITGNPHEVLPRLADSGYDMVVIGAGQGDLMQYVEQAERLLRVGGLVIIENALANGRVADPANREEPVVALRTLHKYFLDAPQWLPALVPVGNGLLAAVKQAI